VNTIDSAHTEPNVVEASPPRSSRRRRVLIGIGLIIWFMLLMLPCLFFTLAFNQEIAIATGDLPGQQLRVWLVMEVTQRGLGYSTASVDQRSETSACLTTRINFLLWQGRGEPASYCECFTRASASDPWMLTSVDMAACSPTP